MKERCALYCRISREDEGGTLSESIANQQAMLTAYADEQGWTVADCYIDEDMSGMSRSRPRWNAMLRDAQRGRFDIILCKTQSRFTRDMEMVERYIHGLLPRWGIRFVAVLDHVDTGQRGGKKARQINGLVNEWYLEDLSENIRAVLAHKRQQGEYLGSRPLYGYRRDPADRHHLLPDPAQADTVRWIFDRALHGWGRQAIASELNRRGILPPGGDLAGRWSRTAVGRILRNEMYTGTLVQGRYRRVDYKSDRVIPCSREAWVRCPGQHAALVDGAVFRSVQAGMNGRMRPGREGCVHVLAGLVFCGDCGARMVRAANRGGTARTEYLVCGRYRERGREACTRHGIRLDSLTAAVSERAEALLDEAGCPMEGGQPPPPPAGGEAAREKERVLLDKTLTSLYTDKVRGILSEEEFLVLRADLARRREALAPECREEDAPAEDDGGGMRRWLREMVRAIRVWEADPATGVQQAEVEWNV